MAVQRMSPRIRPAEVVPVFPKGRPPRALAWVVIVFALVPALLALLDDRIGFRLVMGALALVCLTVGIGLLVMFAAVSTGVVTIDARAQTLRFRPSAGASLPTTVMACSLLLPALAQFVVDTNGLPTMSSAVLISRAPYVLGVLGLALLAVRAWRMRVPAGLELTPDGLRGIRGAGAVAVPWGDLAEVTVVAAPAAKLSLVPRGGVPVLAPALVLGSDPNQVAAIVRHFLRAPADRVVLGEGGAAAVRRVEQAVASR